MGEELGAAAEARRQRDSVHNRLGLDHSSRQAANLGFRVHPDPVLIAIEDALWGSIRARGFHGARLQPQSAWAEVLGTETAAGGRFRGH